MSARTSRRPVTVTERPVSAAVSRTTVWFGSSPWSTAPPGRDQTPGVPEREEARTRRTRPSSSVATAYAAIRRSGSSAGVTGGILPGICYLQKTSVGFLTGGWRCVTADQSVVCHVTQPSDYPQWPEFQGRHRGGHRGGSA